MCVWREAYRKGEPIGGRGEERRRRMKRGYKGVLVLVISLTWMNSLWLSPDTINYKWLLLFTTASECRESFLTHFFHKLSLFYMFSTGVKLSSVFVYLQNFNAEILVRVSQTGLQSEMLLNATFAFFLGGVGRMRERERKFNYKLIYPCITVQCPCNS